MARFWVWALLTACDGMSEAPPDTPDASVADFGPRDAGDAGPVGGPFNDEFSGPALDPRWQRLGGDALDLSFANGELELRLNRHALWFEASQGTLIHQPIQGDFDAVTVVRARSASNPEAPPSRFVHLGGLMARDPNKNSENYVFIVVGFDENDLSVETKTTKDNVSQYEGPTWGSGDAKLRLCRRGDDFFLYKAQLQGDWTLAATYNRPDLGDTLQVGLNPYAFSENMTPDLLVRYESFLVTQPGDCAP